MRDIRFENIRCHDVHDTLINCWIGADMWGKDTTRGRIQGVVFKDITVTGTNRPLVKLTGFDAQHRVEDVTFERVGPIRSVQTNAHVNSVRFIGEQTK
jgi:hypothetical protein